MLAVHFYRPQRNWGKVMFFHVSVILFTGSIPAYIAGGIPVCLAVWGLVSQHALQVSRPTPRGEVEGSGLGKGSPGTHPGGGEVEGSGLGGLQAHTGGISRPTPGRRGSPGPHPGGIPACTEADPPMATAVGGTHPTGMHSCLVSKLTCCVGNTLLCLETINQEQFWILFLWAIFYVVEVHTVKGMTQEGETTERNRSLENFWSVFTLAKDENHT